MCGIVGFVGKEKALPRVLSGLKFLEYRGYDSAGVAYAKDNEIIIKKEVGRIKNLENIINMDEDTYMAIGHTRWATHGVPSKVNSHPHRVNKFTVVHNGIIENYLEIKNMLINNNYKFISETDTEVIPALLDYNYKKEKNIINTINKTINMLKGSFALEIISNLDSDSMIVVRKDSPLVIGKADGENFKKLFVNGD